jgi:hypothetical protein
MSLSIYQMQQNFHEKQTWVSIQQSKKKRTPSQTPHGSKQSKQSDSHHRKEAKPNSQSRTVHTNLPPASSRIPPLQRRPSGCS